MDVLQIFDEEWFGASTREEYRGEQDVVGLFLAERCDLNPHFRCRASSLYDEYKRWAEAAGEHFVNQRRFGNAMTERGFGRSTNNGTWYLGIGIRDERTEGTE